MLLPNRTLTSVLLIYCLGLAATASAAQHAFQSYCSAKSLSEVALNASWIKEETEAYRVDAGQISNPFYKEALLLAARNYFLKKPSEFDLAIFFLTAKGVCVDAQIAAASVFWTNGGVIFSPCASNPRSAVHTVKRLTRTQLTSIA